MSIHICLYTCLYTYVYTHVYTHMSIHICLYTCLCACPYTRRYTRPCVRRSTCLCTRLCADVHACACLCMPKHVCADRSASAYACLYHGHMLAHVSICPHPSTHMSVRLSVRKCTCMLMLTDTSTHMAALLSQSGPDDNAIFFEASRIFF